MKSTIRLKIIDRRLRFIRRVKRFQDFDRISFSCDREVAFLSSFIQFLRFLSALDSSVPFILLDGERVATRIPDAREKVRARGEDETG